MAEYIVACHLLEMPYGRIFTTIPKFPYEKNELVLLSLRFESEDRTEPWLIPGRWHPGEDGLDCLRLPGLLIELTERIFYYIVGLVVPLDEQPCWN